jgi:hypothetical protein
VLPRPQQRILRADADLYDFGRDLFLNDRAVLGLARADSSATCVASSRRHRDFPGPGHPKKIIVLGAGVISVTTTYYLARDGHPSR